MQLVSANNTSTIEPQYIERLKNNYLKKIEVNGADIVGEFEMKIGIEPTPAGFLIEFHLPGDGISSNLFILEYAYATVTQSIFKSCVVYFNELHLKYKKRHNNFDRISYPLQVRHAVIHHFTAAAKGMLSLRPMWDRGRKSHEYWGSLLSNPIISDQLTRSIWSLGQAQILMDNSRFLFADISKLSRKNYRIKNVVNNCLQVLADQRQEKSIRVISRIKVLITT